MKRITCFEQYKHIQILQKCIYNNNCFIIGIESTYVYCLKAQLIKKIYHCIFLQWLFHMLLIVY